ncbi:MAG: DUF3149 domain-containing protein [Burkholderiaceae bacterium]|jgi:hypothetical protein|nr:DUF3149 domain-containing protein [Burkholderiaceae bacterium]
MRALQELFSTDVGILSVIVIGFMLGMGVYFIRFFTSHAKESPPAERR